MSATDGGSQPGPRERWNERHAAGAPIESPEPDETLIEEVGGLRPGRALDLGTGDGRNAVWLATRGWRVTAVDFSPVALDRGRLRARSRGVKVRWLLADLLAWRPPRARFDLVLLFFIHLPSDQRREVLARAASAVAPGGRLLVVGHDRSNLADGVGGPRDPLVLFTPDEVAGELSGLAVERAEAVPRKTGQAKAPIDAVVRAIKPPARPTRMRDTDTRRPVSRAGPR